MAMLTKFESAQLDYRDMIAFSPAMASYVEYETSLFFDYCKGIITWDDMQQALAIYAADMQAVERDDYISCHIWQ